ncbi:hypothetical protein BKA61DRAFT_586558 [Leptodontidium sp. MPI-SDFR-AT-0119]|nr:hypothetical protein BKA61DRAFT_586558 [Leptodontidium sp. MPI-SDFR-AT-0119]
MSCELWCGSFLVVGIVRGEGAGCSPMRGVWDDFVRGGSLVFERDDCMAWVYEVGLIGRSSMETRAGWENLGSILVTKVLQARTRGRY